MFDDPKSIGTKVRQSLFDRSFGILDRDACPLLLSRGSRIVQDPVRDVVWSTAARGVWDELRNLASFGLLTSVQAGATRSP